MKLYQLILLVLSTGFISGHKGHNKTTITGKIVGEIPEIIEYTIPLNGVSFFGFEDSVQPDSSGNFQVELEIEKPCFIEFSKGYQAYGTVIAEPEMNYVVFIDTEDKENIFRIECKNEKGQNLYNQISNRSMIAGGHFELEAKKYLKDSIRTEIEQSLEQKEEIERAGFRQLFENKVISEDFYNLVCADREYFYKGAQGSVGFGNFLYSERGQNKLTKEEYSALWREIFQSHPVSNPELLQSPWFYYYVENYLRYNQFIKDSIDTKTLSELRKQGLIHTHNIEYAKKYLSGKHLEYYYAAYIIYQAIYKEYEEELISLFEQFKKEYPSSEYSHFIESEIIPIISFHKKQSEPLNENINFIIDSESINSLKEAVQKLNGERIYVDVWATWCGPCKKEFEHNVAFYKLLKSKEIPLLYLSVDKDDREKQWKDMINYYDLEGYHIRVNEKLYTHLKDLRGDDSFSIPWHILIDNNGNIIKKYVSGPSEIEKLKEQLNGN